MRTFDIDHRETLMPDSKFITRTRITAPWKQFVKRIVYREIQASDCRFLFRPDRFLNIIQHIPKASFPIVPKEEFIWKHMTLLFFQCFSTRSLQRHLGMT